VHGIENRHHGHEAAGTKTAYFRRVGYESLPTAGKIAAVSATETGENLKSEFERDQIETKVSKEAEDTRDKIDALNFERAIKSSCGLT
jgi:hypothetical protein